MCFVCLFFSPLQTTIESIEIVNCWELFSTVKGPEFVTLKHEKHAEKRENMTHLQVRTI